MPTLRCFSPTSIFSIQPFPAIVMLEDDLPASSSSSTRLYMPVVPGSSRVSCTDLGMDSVVEKNSLSRFSSVASAWLQPVGNQ